MHQYLYAKASPPNYTDRWGYCSTATDPTWRWLQEQHETYDVYLMYAGQSEPVIEGGMWVHYHYYDHINYYTWWEDGQLYGEWGNPYNRIGFRYEEPLAPGDDDGGSNDGTGGGGDGGSGGGSGGSGGGGGTSPPQPTPEETAAGKYEEAVTSGGYAPGSDEPYINSNPEAGLPGDFLPNYRLQEHDYASVDWPVVGGSSAHLIPDDDVAELPHQRYGASFTDSAYPSGPTGEIDWAKVRSGAQTVLGVVGFAVGVVALVTLAPEAALAAMIIGSASLIVTGLQYQAGDISRQEATTSGVLTGAGILVGGAGGGGVYDDFARFSAALAGAGLLTNIAPDTTKLSVPGGGRPGMGD